MDWQKELWPEWQIESELGSSAYGTVYKIKREDLGGTYYAALKVISFPQSTHEIELMQIRKMTDSQIADYYNKLAAKISREIAVMERFKGHTNIVSYEDHKIVSHENDPGWDILIRMELLTPLSKYLNTHGISEDDVRKIGIDICNALVICEKEKVIHRDIKPGNVFVSDFGNYKLGDFGLAKSVGILSETTARQGTFDFMAPEVFNESGYDQTIDIYSLGLILYCLLNKGRKPFMPLPPEPVTAEMSDKANIQRIKADVLPEPVDASPYMTSIILKACAHDPGDRYRSAEDMLKDLNGQEDHAEKEEEVSHFAKIIRRITDAIPEKKIENVNSSELRIKESNNDNTMDDFFSAAGEL